MATKNPKIQGYLKPALYNAYEQFKKDRGIDSDSQALNLILGDYLGIAKDAPLPNLYEYQPDLIDRKIDAAIIPLIRRIDEVEFIKCNLLSRLNDYLDGNLVSNLSELKDILSGNILNNPESELESNPESELESNPESELESNPESELESNPESELESNPESELESNPESELESNPESELESNPESEQLGKLGNSLDAVEDEQPPKLISDSVEIKELVKTTGDYIEGKDAVKKNDDDDLLISKGGKSPAVTSNRLLREIRNFADDHTNEETLERFKEPCRGKRKHLTYGTLTKIKTKQSPYDFD